MTALSNTIHDRFTQQFKVERAKKPSNSFYRACGIAPKVLRAKIPERNVSAIVTLLSENGAYVENKGGRLKITYLPNIANTVKEVVKFYLTY